MKYNGSAIFVWALALSLVCARDTQAEPRIVFPELSGNLGKMLSGSVAEHRFTFRNEGDQPLLITDTRASCGCTQVTPSERNVPPGESGEILVVFDSHWFSGIVEKHVEVHTNDLRNQVVTLTIEADVSPVIEVNPRDLDFGVIQMTKTKDTLFNKYIVVKDLIRSGLEVKSVDTNKPFLEAQVEESKDYQIWIKVQLIPGQYRGFFQGLVKITTNSGAYPTLFAIARGEVQD